MRRYFLPIIASAVVLTACSSTPPAGPGALDLSSQSTAKAANAEGANTCLLYTSPSPRDRQKSRMPSSA